jgi:hypothetical protein
VQREPGAGLSNRSPRVSVRWDSKQLGITGADVSDLLDSGEPRIALGGGGGGGGRGGGQGQERGDTGISITSAMMSPGDEKIVAQRVVEVLSGKHTLRPVEAPAAPVANLSGRWAVEIQYAVSRSTHTLHLQQSGNRLEGTHQGDFLARDISGTITADSISLASSVTERHGDALAYRFSGKVTGESGGSMSGTLDLGEYLKATWTARRHTSSPRS